VFTRPEGLPDALLLNAARGAWGLDVSSLEYQAVGFGSHHWTATDTRGDRWFLTVDDLVAKCWFPDDSTSSAFQRLKAAFHTARALSDAGGDFVVAPIVSLDGTVVRRITEGFALAIYPYIEGRAASDGEYETASDRLEVLSLILKLHRSPEATTGDATVDEFLIPYRKQLFLALDVVGTPWDDGPFSEPARALLAQHATGVRRLFTHYDQLVEEARTLKERFVLTHGEPHRANVIRTGTGWMLIDWDTAMVAPPERDLWMLDAGDGQVLAAYERATGRQALSSMLELYKLGWDLGEVAIYIAGFRAPHTETADTQESWDNLRYFLDPWRRWPSLLD
jgi:spectinomycin phosphotransferase/16S rRNA (guanine(1405)-N(7))-methyltransferase